MDEDEYALLLPTGIEESFTFDARIWPRFEENSK
jgi:hypothetical protein